MRICLKCKIERLEEHFYKDASVKDGLSKWCKECKKTQNKLQYRNNKEEYLKRKGVANKAYRQSDRGKEVQYRYQRKKYKLNVQYRLQTILRASLLIALKKHKSIKKSSTEDMLGCSIIQFRIYLESLFKEGMNWDNQGKDGWEIDHIKPVSLFDLTKEEEQRKCFHYTNLQPLWKGDNRIKSNKYEI